MCGPTPCDLMSSDVVHVTSCRAGPLTVTCARQMSAACRLRQSASLSHDGSSTPRGGGAAVPNSNLDQDKVNNLLLTSLLSSCRDMLLPLPSGKGHTLSTRCPLPPAAHAVRHTLSTRCPLPPLPVPPPLHDHCSLSAVCEQRTTEAVPYFPSPSVSLTCCWYEALSPHSNGHPVEELLPSIKQLTLALLLVTGTVSLDGTRQHHGDIHT